MHVGVRGERRGRPAQGSGSGVILSPDGLILTNNHVVEGAASSSVTLADGRSFMARILGVDPDTDLAVLRGDTADHLPTAVLANSKLVRARTGRDCHRQSAWLSVDRLRRHRQRRGTLVAGPERPPDR